MKRGFNKLNLTGLAMLMLPIIMIKMMALMLGVGFPKGVTASTNQPSLPTIIQGLKHGSPQAHNEVYGDAIAHIESLREVPLTINPMLYGGRASQPSVSSPSITQLYRLQMIMSTTSGKIALINNQQYEVGDRFGETPWRIVAINGDTREVVARHDVTALETILRVD